MCLDSVSGTVAHRRTGCLDLLSMSTTRAYRARRSRSARRRPASGSWPPFASCSPRGRSTTHRRGGRGSRRHRRGPRSTSTSARGSSSSTRSARPSTRTPRCSSSGRSVDARRTPTPRSTRRSRTPCASGRPRTRCSRQLYGVAAIDPAAAGARRPPARRPPQRDAAPRAPPADAPAGCAPASARSTALATLMLLTSYETFRELREAGLSEREVTRILLERPARCCSREREARSTADPLRVEGGVRGVARTSTTATRTASG